MSIPAQPNATAPQLFSSKGGTIGGGFSAIHAQVFHSPGGVPYLREPGVVMLARPQVSLDGLDGFLGGFSPTLGFDSYLKDDPLPPAASLSKVAGQACYLSFGQNRTKNAQAARYFDNIMASGHGSVLEHPSFSFLIYGVSRSFTHELVRHRAGTAFSQTSQRYVDGKVLRFVERPEYFADPILHKRFEQGIEGAAQEYAERTEYLLDAQKSGSELLSGEARTDQRKKVQQAARSCLPNETEAPIVLSANVRAFRHMIEMRASAHAEIEIREVFLRLFLCLVAIEPYLFGDYQLDMLSDGTYGVTTPHRKV